jgi:hypothetical protein
LQAAASDAHVSTAKGGLLGRSSFRDEGECRGRGGFAWDARDTSLCKPQTDALNFKLRDDEVTVVGTCTCQAYTPAPNNLKSSTDAYMHTLNCWIIISSNDKMLNMLFGCPALNENERTISRVAQTVTNSRRIRRQLEALVSRHEISSRLRPPSEKIRKSSPISHHASPRDLLVSHRALGNLALL